MVKQKKSHFWNNPAVTGLYYLAKPAIPRSVQIMLRRAIVKRYLPRLSSVWPINESAGQFPEGWKGWPQGKKFALVLTHDVESDKGVERCRQLAQMEMVRPIMARFQGLRLVL